jgi:predicted membrane metal-binding protein
MTPDQPTNYPCRPTWEFGAPSWPFAAGFAAVVFLVTGLIVFYAGYRRFNPPPPPPPGTGYCGNAALGGLCAMVVVAPIAAILAALLGGLIGAGVDLCRGEWRRQKSITATVAFVSDPINPADDPFELAATTKHDPQFAAVAFPAVHASSTVADAASVRADVQGVEPCSLVRTAAPYEGRSLFGPSGFD